MEIFLKDAFKISILLNPFAVLSTFIALTGSRTSGQRLRIMIHTCLAALAAGAAVPFCVLALFLWQAYGAPWRTGYSLTDESSSFELRFVWDNLLIYLPEFFMLVVGPGGLAAPPMRNGVI